MKKFLGALAALTFVALGAAVPSATAQTVCGATSPATATDIAALQADADCYGAQASAEQSQSQAQSQAAAAAQAQHDALVAQAAQLQAQADAANQRAAQLQQSAATDQAAQQARLARITYLKSLPPPVVWTKCAGENQTCYVVGTANVRYGANGKYVTKSVTGSIACSNGIFGDPIFGTVKTCDTDGKVGSAPAPAPTPAPAPMPMPAPAPAPAPAGMTLPNGPSDIISGLPDVPDGLNYADVGFTAANVLVKAPVPGKNCQTNGIICDDVGAFRFICGPGQLLRDDPVMFPGQPGKSHLHQFYGNTGADANSTYQSLRTSNAPSTCQGGAAKVLNRSAYWMPALLDGNGNVVRPDYVAIYYKRFPLSDPRCTRGNPQAIGDCIPLPNGLRYIFGRDMTNLAAPPTGNYNFSCQTVGGGTIIAPTTSMDTALKGCPVGAQFEAGLSSPYCWDGKNLDSADHRSHTSYPSYGSWGFLKCDAAHPYVLPQFSIGARYTITATDDTSKWIFSSDVAMNQPRGTTFHADWFGAWDNAAVTAWTTNCINKLLTCIGGQLGNGTGLPGGYGPTTPANPHLVPLSSIP